MPRGPADRTASIAALLASGDAAGAADELRAFRTADPDADAYLPESLRAWALTVKRRTQTGIGLQIGAAMLDDAMSDRAALMPPCATDHPFR